MFFHLVDMKIVVRLISFSQNLPLVFIAIWYSNSICYHFNTMAAQQFFAISTLDVSLILTHNNSRNINRTPQIIWLFSSFQHDILYSFIVCSHISSKAHTKLNRNGKTKNKRKFTHKTWILHFKCAYNNNNNIMIRTTNTSEFRAFSKRYILAQIILIRILQRSSSYLIFVKLSIPKITGLLTLNHMNPFCSSKKKNQIKILINKYLVLHAQYNLL